MSSKIKVLHIIKSLGRGGAEMLLPETLACHDQQRFEFHYIYFLPWKHQMVEALRQAGGKVSCFEATNNIQIILRYRKVIRYVREQDIQLIHAHLPWAGFLSRFIHKLTGIPVVYTEHNKQERYHGITFMLNKLTFNWQTLGIAVSDDVNESIRKNIRPKIPVATVLNGVNTKRFVRDESAGKRIRQEHGIPENALVVGTVAVFRFQKRLIEWLEIMKSVCDADSRVFGIIVGDGPLKNEILEKRKLLGLEDRILAPGLITEVRPWMSAMDIYMMSSVFEGLPIALLEAMSMQCAIATTNAGGIREVVRNKVDGLVVDVDNWKNLSECIDILKDQQTRATFAAKARERVSASFSLERMVEALESIYESSGQKR